MAKMLGMILLDNISDISSEDAGSHELAKICCRINPLLPHSPVSGPLDIDNMSMACINASLADKCKITSKVLLQDIFKPLLLEGTSSSKKLAILCAHVEDPPDDIEDIIDACNGLQPLVDTILDPDFAAVDRLATEWKSGGKSNFVADLGVVVSQADGYRELLSTWVANIEFYKAWFPKRKAAMKVLDDFTKTGTVTGLNKILPEIKTMRNFLPPHLTFDTMAVAHDALEMIAKDVEDEVKDVTQVSPEAISKAALFKEMMETAVTIWPHDKFCSVTLEWVTASCDAIRHSSRETDAIRKIEEILDNPSSILEKLENGDHLNVESLCSPSFAPNDGQLQVLERFLGTALDALVDDFDRWDEHVEKVVNPLRSLCGIVPTINENCRLEGLSAIAELARTSIKLKMLGNSHREIANVDTKLEMTSCLYRDVQRFVTADDKSTRYPDKLNIIVTDAKKTLKNLIGIFTGDARARVTELVENCYLSHEAETAANHGIVK